MLRKYGYPPGEYSAKAIDLVLQQAEVLAEGWTDSNNQYGQL
jgi:hypothetical protein